MKQKNYFLLTWLVAAVLSLTASSCSDDDDKDEPTPLENIEMGLCDSGLSLEETDAKKVAAALDICKSASGGDDWGLLTAKYIRANGDVIAVNNQYGLMQDFGPQNSSRKGDRMLVMSTGRARTPSQANNCSSTSCSGTGIGIGSTGIPANVPGCTVSSDINDDVGFEVTLRVPESATGFTIDHQFFTFDYPEFVCNSFNDQFLITVSPEPPGAVSGNTALDSASVPIGVNSAFISPSLSGLLTGTGFDTWGDAATTGWLRTSVPVTGGSTITIRFLIFDVGDTQSDSSVLIDNFKWIQNAAVSLKTEKL